MNDWRGEGQGKLGQAPGFSEHQDDWQIVRNGMNFFRQYFAKEYMVLLD